MGARKSAIFFLEQKYLFCANLVPKFKIICLKRSLVPIRICRNRCRCSLFPFLTGNALLREIQLQNSRFNGEAHIFCFRQEILFLCKFNPKYQNCPFKVKYNTQTHSSFQNLIVMFTFSFFDRKYGKIWENLGKSALRKEAPWCSGYHYSTTFSHKVYTWVQILPAECWKFVKVRISDSGFDWK